MNARFKLEGLNTVTKNLKLAIGRAEKAIGGGLYLEGNNIITDAKILTPVDVGTLKGSGYVTLPNYQDKKIIVEMGFGGNAEDYAVVQHEHVEYHHEQGEAKYLEKPMHRHTGKFSAMVTAFSKRLFDQNQGATKISGTPETPWEGK
jgi:hypothetical protein